MSNYQDFSRTVLLHIYIRLQVKEGAKLVVIVR